MKVAVVGSGAWGTALAIRLCKNGHDVTMWTFETELIPQMVEQHHNPRLPGAVLPENLKISPDYGCVSGCELVVIACPSFPMRSVCKGIAPYLAENTVLVSVTTTVMVVSPMGQSGSSTIRSDSGGTLTCSTASLPSGYTNRSS